MDETDLIARAVQGDEEALAILYNRHAPALYRLAYGLLGDAEDAEEVVQDALTYALRRLDRYDPARSAFTTWLHTITVSRCRNKRRRRRLPGLRLADGLGQGQDLPDPEADPEATVLADEEARQVWEAVQRLSPVVREVVVLRYWGGHTIPEIARIVGCPPATAQSRLRLAHEQLRRHLHPLSTSWSPAEEAG